jgi:hypothetical protein
MEVAFSIDHVRMRAFIEQAYLNPFSGFDFVKLFYIHLRN